MRSRVSVAIYTDTRSCTGQLQSRLCAAFLGSHIALSHVAAQATAASSCTGASASLTPVRRDQR